MTDLLRLLAAGGDLAIIALFFFTLRGFHKLELRLVRLETLLNGDVEDD